MVLMKYPLLSVCQSSLAFELTFSLLFKHYKLFFMQEKNGTIIQIKVLELEMQIYISNKQCSCSKYVLFYMSIQTAV